MLTHLITPLWICFSYLDKCVADSCQSTATCNSEDLPRTYLAYHLNGKTVNIDGKLDEPAWTEVPWSDNFMGKNYYMNSV